MKNLLRQKSLRQRLGEKHIPSLSPPSSIVVSYAIASGCPSLFENADIV